MKRFLIITGTIIALALLILTVILLYKHFITDQIKDKGGMENPNYLIGLENSSNSEQPEDGDVYTPDGAALTTVTGVVVTAELPEGWRLIPGDQAKNTGNFDFIYTSDAIDADSLSVLRDSQDMEHYKEMLATGNYGKDLGTAELGEGTWYITEKVAVGPIGEYTCVVQTYNCDLSSAEVQAVLASLKWAE